MRDDGAVKVSRIIKKQAVLVMQFCEEYQLKHNKEPTIEEISKAMSKEYNVSFSELEVFFYDLILRYDNKLLGDTIARVGKDSKRKLSKNDRFVGAIRLCQKHDIVPANIARGMAAGFLFCPEGDKESVEVATYTKENGVFAALDKYCGIKQTEEVAFMIAKEYENLKNY
jgi:mannitol-1-phosphate 5-dehydrogenase